MPGVGFDVVVVGDLRRTGVPDPAAVARPACESACRPTPHSARRRGRARRRAPASRISAGLSRIGIEDVDARRAPTTMRVVPSAGRSVEHLGDQVGGGLLGPPRRGDDLQHRGAPPRRPARSSTVDVVRAFGGEQRAGVHRRRVERIVVAGQQIHRNADGAHGLQRLADHLAAPAGCARRRRRRRRRTPRRSRAASGTEAGDGVTAGGRIARLRLAVQEVPRHARAASRRCAGIASGRRPSRRRRLRGRRV